MKKNLLILLVALWLTGCGGGGGGGSSGGLVDPVPTPVPMPTPTYRTAQPFNLAGNTALDYLNGERDAAGLGAVVTDAHLTQAAQAHSSWQLLNNAYGHGEVGGTTGFTGSNPGDRLLAAGYRYANADEVIQGAEFNDVSALRLLLAAPYHRAGLLDHRFVDTGMARASNTDGIGAYVAELAFASGSQAQDMKTSAQGVSVYPAPGQTGVSTIFGPESPYPVPELGAWGPGAYPGYAPSVEVRSDQALAVTTFTLTDANGVAIAAKVVDKSDPVVFSPQGVKNWAFLVPLQPLQPGMTYTAAFVGTVDSGGTQVSRTWNFTTRAGIVATAVRENGRTVISMSTPSDYATTTLVFNQPGCGTYSGLLVQAGMTLLVKDQGAAPPAACTFGLRIRDTGSGTQQAVTLSAY